MNKQEILALKVVTLIIGVFFLLGETNAQEGWNLQLEPMYMGVAGANSHFANITTSSGCCSSPVQTSFTTSQNFGMGGNGTFRGQLEYMPGDWGVGISGWWFDTSGSINQSINQNLYSVGYNSNNFNNSNGPGYWGLLKSSANNNLGVWNLDAYVIKSLGEFQNGGINLTFGAKFGGFNNNTTEAFNPGQTGYVGSFTSGGYIVTNTTTKQNATNSANASFLVGPSISIQGSGKYGNHRLEGLLGQSVLIGNVNRKAFSVSYYSDQYTYYQYRSSSYTTAGPSYAYNTSFYDSETVAIPVTEMKIKYLYDVTENLSLGLGFFASLWVDTPTPPAVQANGQQYKTLVFYGGLGSINLRY